MVSGERAASQPGARIEFVAADPATVLALTRAESSLGLFGTLVLLWFGVALPLAVLAGVAVLGPGELAVAKFVLVLGALCMVHAVTSHSRRVSRAYRDACIELIYHRQRHKNSQP